MEHFYSDECKSEFEMALITTKETLSSFNNEHNLTLYCIEARAGDGLWIPTGGANVNDNDKHYESNRGLGHYVNRELMLCGLFNRVTLFRNAKDAAKEVECLKVIFLDRKLSFKISRYPMPSHLANQLIQSQQWAARELSRFADNTYTNVPWSNETWWLEGQATLKHFAHVSIKNPNKIAYTLSHEAGVSDRQVTAKIGTYLQSYYGTVLRQMDSKDSGRKNVDGNTVFIYPLEYYVEQFVSTFGDDNTLHFASTADDIEHVFAKGPTSCMSHYDNNHPNEPWPSGVAPTRIYAAGDLSLAYTKNKEDEITARALVWPSKLLVGRIYGDSCSLQGLLTKVGYERSDINSLTGARLAVIMADDGYVMPYIDGSGVYTYALITNPVTGEKKRQFYLGDFTPENGKVSSVNCATYQNGLDHEVEVDENGAYCECCEGFVGDDDINTVYVGTDRQGEPCDTEYWCSDCCYDGASMDDYDDRYYSHRHFELVTVEGYGQVSQYNLERHIDYFVSDLDDTYYVISLLAGTLNGDDDLKVSKDDLHAFKLTFDDETDSYYEPANYLALLVDRYDLDDDITLPEVLYYIEQHAEKEIELNLAFAEAA